MNELTTDRSIETIENEIIVLTAQAQKAALVFICEIGQRLFEAKEMVGHGNWGTWLSERVHYSQSTAENYIKIYNEFGSNQISLFETSNSEALTNLGYTKLLALAAISEDDRNELIENHDLEDISTRELKQMIEDIKKQKEELELDLEDSERNIKKQQEEIEKQEVITKSKEDEINSLNEKIKSLEGQLSLDDKDDYKEKLRAEYEKKLEKAKADKKKAEEEKSRLEDSIKEKESKIADTANALAEDIASVRVKEATEQISSERDQMVKKVSELEKKVSVAQNQDIPLINFYFTEIQGYIKKLGIGLNSLRSSDADMYQKLSSGVKKTLQSHIEEL